MKAEVRRVVAYTVGLVSGRAAKSLYDCDARNYFMFTGIANSTVVDIYDYAGGTRIWGTLPLLFHHVSASHIRLEITGPQFSGFDYSSGTHFRGNVVQNRVVLFDYEADSQYEYFV